MFLNVRKLDTKDTDTCRQRDSNRLPLNWEATALQVGFLRYRNILLKALFFNNVPANIFIEMIR